MEPGLTFAGRYRLVRELARGGMGSVWVAQDERLSRKVAIKFMSQDLQGAEGEQRFHREAAAAAQLRTKHVVEIFDHGVADHTPFIVMELLEGESLSSLLRRRRRLTLRECVSLVEQIAKGLRVAHGEQIVHRDLKPQNIFMARDADGDETVKILDFGVAKHRSATAPGDSTATGVLLGSPHYMSPEQSRGVRDIDHRSDLWSLAVILYRALTGKRPWQSESIVDLLVIICTEPFVPPSQLVPELPSAVDGFFACALGVEPDARFADVNELVRAFRAAAGVVMVDGTGQQIALSSAPELRAPLSSMSTLSDAPPDSEALDNATTIRRESAHVLEPVDAGTFRGATATHDRGAQRSASWIVVGVVALGMAGIGVFAWLASPTEARDVEVDPPPAAAAGEPSFAGTAVGPEPPPEPAPHAAPDPAASAAPVTSASASASTATRASADPPPAPKPLPRRTPTKHKPKPGNNDVPWF